MLIFCPKNSFCDPNLIRALYFVGWFRPVIKENTAHVVAACQNVSLLWCVISMKLNIGKKITGLEIITMNHEKNLACFQTSRTDVQEGVILFTEIF